MRLTRGAATFAFVVAAACTTSVRAHAVENGVEDRKTTHVVAIVAGGPSAPVVRCTGTLVSPNVVLTVRHCIAQVDAPERDCRAVLGDPRGAEDLWVTASPWVTDNFHRVARAIVPEPRGVCGDDIALLVVSDVFPRTEASPARPVTDAATFRRVAGERVIGLAGFGATSVSATDAGVRRSRWDVPVRCIPGEPGFACGPELDYIGPLEFTAGSGPCRGDSGGPALVRGEPDLFFGVLARGNLGNECAEGVYERTDIWAWLIGRTVLEASSSQTPAPSWATTLFSANPREGEFCHGDASCGADAACVSLDERRSWRCARRCIEGACSGSSRCENGVCVPASGAAPEQPADSCTTSAPHRGSRATNAAVTTAIFFVGALARVRRGRRDRSCVSSTWDPSGSRSRSPSESCSEARSQRNRTRSRERAQDAARERST